MVNFHHYKMSIIFFLAATEYKGQEDIISSVIGRVWFNLKMLYMLWHVLL